MQPVSLQILQIYFLISSVLFSHSLAAFVFEVKLVHYQNVERLLFDGKTRCGATIDVPCAVSMEFCVLKKPEGFIEEERMSLWAAGLPYSSLDELSCIIREKTATPLDRVLGSSGREGADRNLFFIEGSILNESPKLENPLEFDIDKQMAHKDLMMIVIVYHNSVDVMDVFTWNAPSTGLPLQQAMNPADGDPGGWMDDTLVNVQVSRKIDNERPSKFVVKVRNLCAPNYYDAPNGCNVLCAPKPDSNYDCDTLTGAKVCRQGYMNPADKCRELINKCDSSPCSNGATCVQDGADSRGFACQCAKGFRGPNCEIDVDECSETADGKPDESVKCLNGGTCVDRVGGFDCECAPGFMGPRCNSSGPCFNYCSGSGSCVLLNPAATVCNSIFCNCSCDVGFKGVRCEENVNECESNPCNSEHAKCRDTIGGYECDCEEGYAGEKCDQDLDECRFQNCIFEKCTSQITAENITVKEASINTCIINNIDCWHPDPLVREPCLGGQCINKMKGEVDGEDRGYFCVCPEGYGGPNCLEPLMRECQRLIPCKNGGTCLNRQADYICKCPEGFRGKTCEDVTEDPGSRDTGEPYGGVPVFTLIIILATIYTLAFVMAMAWVIWLWMRRENSKTDIFFAIPNPTVSRSNSYKQVGVY